MSELFLPLANAESVRRILWTHRPSNVRVSVSGSRATGRRLKPHLDLGLLIDSPVALPLMLIADAREALVESNFPFYVELLDRRDASAEFLTGLAQEGMVEPAADRADPHPPMTQTNPPKVALITGVTGQDGADLSELLQFHARHLHCRHRPGQRASLATRNTRHFDDLSVRVVNP